MSWKAITAINAAGLSPFVAEGERNSVLSTTEVDKSQSYKSIGHDDFTTFEAIQAAEGFEDVRALSVANTLSALMVDEEKAILGGNATDIGKPAATGFSAADEASAGPFTAATAYDFGVSALTLFGYLNGATGRSGGVDANGETDGRTLTTFSTGSGKTSVTLTWAAVRGAVAYNVFIGTHSGTLYYAFTTTQTSITINSTVLAALPGSGNTPNTADQSGDALAFDGIIPQIQAAGGGAYFKDLAGGTLTADNAGGISQWDVALKYLYDHSRIGPSLVLVSSQEAQNALRKIAANGSSTVLRLTAAVAPDGSVSGGLMLADYLNKFTQQRVPVMTHPYLPAGNTLFLSEKLPYPNNNVPNVFEIDVRQEYTQYEWALVKRRYEYGVYASECLKAYFPAGCAALVGGADG